MKTDQQFSVTLRSIMHAAGIKNAALAKALQYDISYVSKWISGKKLPSSRNIEETVSIIAATAVSQASSEQLNAMYVRFSCNDRSVLEVQIKKALMNAYSSEKHENDHGVLTINSNLSCATSFSVHDLLDDEMKLASHSKTALLMMDVFDLPHDEQLFLCGIKDGSHEASWQQNEDELVLILDVSECHDVRRITYNAIYLVHLFTRFSVIPSLKVYHSNLASGKSVLMADQKYLLMGMLLRNSEQCLSYLRSSSQMDYDAVYYSVGNVVTQENLLLKPTTIDEMVETNEYMKMFVSTNKRIILGHISETFIPPELFETLLSRIDSPYKPGYRKNHDISTKVLAANTGIELLIYESAVADFMIEGEVDLFNNRLIVPTQERIMIIQYLKRLLDETKCSVRMIAGGFNDEFVHLPNPCMFISDFVCCFRLENRLYRNNVFTTHHSSMRNVYVTCFQEMWSNRPDVVINDRDEIRAKLDYYIHSAELLGL